MYFARQDRLTRNTTAHTNNRKTYATFTNAYIETTVWNTYKPMHTHARTPTDAMTGTQPETHTYSIHKQLHPHSPLVSVLRRITNLESIKGLDASFSQFEGAEEVECSRKRASVDNKYDVRDTSDVDRGSDGKVSFRKLSLTCVWASGRTTVVPRSGVAPIRNCSAGKHILE